jgi:hypothetical protein
MGKSDIPTESLPATQAIQDAGLNRRSFLLRAGALGLSALAFESLLAACNTPNPTPIATATATATATPTPTVPPPRATSTPRPTATPRPSATPTPTPALPAPDLELTRIGHLLRRAGFGASQADYNQFSAMGLSATVDYLLDYESVDNSDLDRRLASVELDLTRLGDLQQWWLLRMVYTKRPLQEKMVLFWHGHLTSSFKRTGQGPFMHTQNELFRAHALDNYDVLVKAVSRDPAMLIWLDSQSNNKRAPNENYSRELMELFTMGLGNYTEVDVRESARAFTGWGLQQRKFTFNTNAHDYDTKQFLGKTGNFDGDDIADIILDHPATADFMCRKLFAFFAYDDPEPEVIAPLTATFKSSGYSIKAVVREILTSPAFYSAKAYRTKIKSPTDLVVGAFHSLALETDGRAMRGMTDIMGQSLFAPPNVSGWEGGEAWINSSTLLQRLNFVNIVATARNQRLQFDPVKLLLLGGISSPEEALDYFAFLLLDGTMPEEERRVLQAYLASLDDRFGTQGADEKLRSLAYLVMASPEYQLA